MTKVHLKAGRKEEADALQQLVWSKCGRKHNYTPAAVLQAALDVEEHRKAERPEDADILEQPVWSRHEIFDRWAWLTDAKR